MKKNLNAKRYSEVVFKGDWDEVIVAFDKIEANNDKTETRRHYHIEANVYEGEEYGYEDPGFAEVENADEQTKAERLKEVIKMLPEKDQDLIVSLFYENKSVTAYAAECGVTPGAITQRKATIFKKIKKFF